MLTPSNSLGTSGTQHRPPPDRVLVKQLLGDSHQLCSEKELLEAMPQLLYWVFHQPSPLEAWLDAEVAQNTGVCRILLYTLGPLMSPTLPVTLLPGQWLLRKKLSLKEQED